MCVIPQLISRNKYIYSVDDEFNGVVIKGLYYDKQFMFGRGAGGHPTGSAILSDITACLYDYRYEYKKRNHPSGAMPEFTDDVTFRIYCRYSSSHDLSLIPFDRISESYTSDGFNYVVGETSLHALHSVADKLRRRAYLWRHIPEINRGLCHRNRSCVPMMEIFQEISADAVMSGMRNMPISS